MSRAMTKITIDIVSDTVCPWCYIGKKKLDAAIQKHKELYPEDEFSTTWKPFYLNPGASKVGIDKRAHYLQKFGNDPERAKAIFARLSSIGEPLGINFSFGGKTGNTRDSHRLIQLGKSKSPAQQTRVVEELFRSYFEQEGDITDRDTIAKAAVRAGLDEAEVKDWLASGKGGEAVDREVTQAKADDISGVPNFTVQGKYEVGGAQDESVFLNLFERIKAAGEA